MDDCVAIIIVLLFVILTLVGVVLRRVDRLSSKCCDKVVVGVDQ